MIEHVVGHFVWYGVIDVVFLLGFCFDVFEVAYLDCMCVGVAVCYVVELEFLDIGGVIGFVVCHELINDIFLVCNGDVIIGFDIGVFVK